MVNYLVSVDSETKELPESVAAALPFSPKTVVDRRTDEDGNTWLVQIDGTELPLGNLKGEPGPNTIPTQTAVATAVEKLSFQGFVDPMIPTILRLSYYDKNAADVVGDTVLDTIPDVPIENAVHTLLSTAVLEGGKLPASLLPTIGTATGTTRKALTLGTGFVLPAWGRQPSYSVVVGDAHLAGHLAPGSSDLIVGAVVVTGGAWTAGVKATAATDTGRVLLRSTATTLEIESILTGSAPTWLSLDGVIV